MKQVNHIVSANSVDVALALVYYMLRVEYPKSVFRVALRSIEMDMHFPHDKFSYIFDCNEIETERY